MFSRLSARLVRPSLRWLRPASSRSSHGFSFEALEVRKVLDGGGIGSSNFAEGEGGQVQDFALVDVNATSASYQQSVSPRDYLEQVSAWYFGHAS